MSAPTTMTSTSQSNTFRVTDIGHGSFHFPDPIGGSVDEEIGTTDVRPSWRLSPAITIDSYGVMANARTSMRFTPVVRGTKADLTYSLLTYDGTNGGTVVVANMRAMAYKANFNEKPHGHGQDFKYDAGDTENLAPISFT